MAIEVHIRPPRCPGGRDRFAGGRAARPGFRRGGPGGGNDTGKNSRRQPGRRADLQGHPLWRNDRRCQPLSAAGAGNPMGRGPRRPGVRCVRAAAPSLRTSPGGLVLHDPAGQRGLPVPECLHPLHRTGTPAGHGVAAWRRLGELLRHRTRLRRDQSGARRRRGRGDDQSPAELVRLPQSRRQRSPFRRFRQRRRSGHGGRAPMGPRQRGGVWRRPRQRHDLRPIGRRGEGDSPHGHAGRPRPVPQSDRAKLLRRPAPRRHGGIRPPDPRLGQRNWDWRNQPALPCKPCRWIN